MGKNAKSQVGAKVTQLVGVSKTEQAPVPTSYALKPEQIVLLKAAVDAETEVKVLIADAVVELLQHYSILQQRKQYTNQTLDRLAGSFGIPRDGSQRWKVSPDLTTMTKV